MRAQLARLLRDGEVIVCCGSGGVGKTTVSAALGLAAARRGRNVLVCTIDPARRLASSLGLKELASEAYRVPDAILEEAGVPLPEGGALSAMMLDTKSTFDRLIERHAATEEVARRILTNHVYQQFSSQLAGSQEYMAMEKLFELHSSGLYDLIVLDTPPTKHALDFLHAPKRLSTFLEASVLKWFLLPLKASGGLRGLGSKVFQKALSLLDSVFGMRIIEELAEFFAAFETLWGGFKERAEKVNALLRRADVAGFIVVSSATRETVQEALFFQEQLRSHALPLAGFVVNRVHPVIADEAPESAARAEVDAKDPGLGEAVRAALEALVELDALGRSDRRNLTRIREVAREASVFIREIPALEHDIHDIAGLAELDEHLVEGREEAVLAG